MKGEKYNLQDNEQVKGFFLERPLTNFDVPTKDSFPQIKPKLLVPNFPNLKGPVILNPSFLLLHPSHLIVPLGWTLYAKWPSFSSALLCLQSNVYNLGFKFRQGENPCTPITQIQLHVVRLCV